MVLPSVATKRDELGSRAARTAQHDAVILRRYDDFIMRWSLS